MEPQLLVVDVPITASAEDATAMLNEPVARGYYVRSINTGEPMRFVFARYAPDTKCCEELQAMDITVANKRETATRIVQLLALQGISRTTTWVTKTLMELA
jgi:hypothetical protein